MSFVEGSQVDLGTYSNTENRDFKSGMAVVPQTDLAGVRAYISSAVANATRIQIIRASDSTVLTSQSISGSGMEVTIDQNLSAGSTYYILIDRNGNNYDYAYRSVQFDYYPVTSTDIEVTAGYDDGAEDGGFAFNFEYVTALTVQTPAAPQSSSLTVNDNDSIDLTVGSPSDWGGSVGSYEIEINRDGTGYSDPSGGPSTPSGSTSTQTYNYGPSSDSQYQRQIGIDSSFKFRVRATNSAGSSDWTHTSVVYTYPIPPHNPSVSRPDANTFQISATTTSDIPYGIQVEFREDTGSGYGGWTNFDYLQDRDSHIVSGNPTTTGSSWTVEYTTGTVYQKNYGTTLQEDARYQFRISTSRKTPNQNPWDVDSKDVYADYGNEGNVFFEDDFESGVLNKWSTYLSDSDSGIQSGSSSRLGISGADQGTYYCRLDSGDDIRVENVIDGVPDTDVIVKAVVATGSMDNDSEQGHIEWYDGSSYQPLQTFNWEYNKQGWVEVTALVSNSLLNNTNNAVRFRGYGGGDNFAVDRVVVSDILHEYTKPAAPTNPTTDESVEGELTLDWIDNTSLSNGSPEWFHRVYGSGDSFTKEFESPPHTWTGLLDGERYEWYPSVVYEQARNGTVGEWWRADGPTVTATTFFPSPTIGSPSGASTTSIDVPWIDESNNESGFRVYYREDGTSSWTQFGTVGANTDFETVTGLDSATYYEFYIEGYTAHTSSESGVAQTRTGKDMTRTATATADAAVGATRSGMTMSRTSTITADAAIDATRYFQEALPDELTRDLSWDFVKAEQGFVSEWVRRIPAEGHGSVALYVQGTMANNPIDVIVEFDADGNGSVDERSGVETLHSANEIAVFPSLSGGEGEYRVIVRDLEPQDILAAVVFGTTHT